jgi:hypothetical protein
MIHYNAFIFLNTDSFILFYYALVRSKLRLELHYTAGFFKTWNNLKKTCSITL